MANAIYDTARELYLTGGLNWLSDNIKVVLVDTNDYTVDLENHAFLEEIPVIARIATSSNLSSKTTTRGIADADNSTFSTVFGDEAEALVIYKDTGTEGTSNLIAYIDTSSGLPISPTGGDITITWNTNGIFQL